MRTILGFMEKMLPYMLLAVPVYAAARFFVIRRRYQKVNWRHEFGLFLFVIFLAGLASQTVLPPFILDADGIRLAGGRTHETWLIPFRFLCYTYEDIVVRHSTYSLLINFLGNVVMFMPFGFFPPLLWRTSGRTAIAAGFGASLLVEITQLFLPRSTDIDDLILNTAGAALGYWLYRLLHRICGRWMDTFALNDGIKRKKVA